MALFGRLLPLEKTALVLQSIFVLLEIVAVYLFLLYWKHFRPRQTRQVLLGALLSEVPHLSEQEEEEGQELQWVSGARRGAERVTAIYSQYNKWTPEFS